MRGGQGGGVRVGRGSGKRMGRRQGRRTNGIRGWNSKLNVVENQVTFQQQNDDQDNNENFLTMLKSQAESIRDQLANVKIQFQEVEEKSPAQQKILIDKNECTGCGRCVSICLRQAITLVNQIAQIDYDECTGCELCISECPRNAIHTW